MKLMQNKKTKELVAAKWIPRMLGHGLPKNVEREIVNHRKLLHPNIIRFKEVRRMEHRLLAVHMLLIQLHSPARVPVVSSSLQAAGTAVPESCV